MKKIVLSILLVLVFGCPIFALDVSISSSEIVENGDSCYFALGVYSLDFSELFAFTLDDSGVSIWGYVGDYFISNENYFIVPLSYSTSEENITGDVVYDYPILMYADTMEMLATKTNYYRLFDYHQVDFLTALLNNGFVSFMIYNLSSEEGKFYSFKISNDAEREEALKVFNRYIDYFY